MQAIESRTRKYVGEKATKQMMDHIATEVRGMIGPLFPRHRIQLIYMQGRITVQVLEPRDNWHACHDIECFSDTAHECHEVRCS